MGAINYRDGVSIGELVVYFPALAIAILLGVRHGFGRSSGWFYLILFSLVRIVGACFQLATISKPTDSTLYIGGAVLQNIALSPLELASLGLLSRLFDGIRKVNTVAVSPHMIRLIQVVVTVGLILGIVGGVQSGNDFTSGGTYVPQTLSKVSVVLYLAGWVAIVGLSVIGYSNISSAIPGDNRILIAVAVAIPLILVRIIYAAVTMFGHLASFNLITGNVTILLCMAILEEFAVVIVYEIMGFTLDRLPKGGKNQQQMQMPAYGSGRV